MGCASSSHMANAFPIPAGVTAKHLPGRFKNQHLWEWKIAIENLLWLYIFLMIFAIAIPCFSFKVLMRMKRKKKELTRKAIKKWKARELQKKWKKKFMKKEKLKQNISSAKAMKKKLKKMKWKKVMKNKCSISVSMIIKITFAVIVCYAVTMKRCAVKIC